MSNYHNNGDVLCHSCYDYCGEPIDMRVLYALPAKNIGVFAGRFSDDAQRHALETIGMGVLPEGIKVVLCVTPGNASRTHKVAEMMLSQGAKLLFDRGGANDRLFPQFPIVAQDHFQIVINPIKVLAWVEDVPEKLCPLVVEHHVRDMLSTDVVDKTYALLDSLSADFQDPYDHMDTQQLVSALSYQHLKCPVDLAEEPTAAEEYAISSLSSDAREQVLQRYETQLQRIEDVAAIWGNYISASVDNGDFEDSFYEQIFSSQKSIMTSGIVMGVDTAIDAYLSGVNVEHLLF